MPVYLVRGKDVMVNEFYHPAFYEKDKMVKHYQALSTVQLCN